MTKNYLERYKNTRTAIEAYMILFLFLLFIIIIYLLYNRISFVRNGDALTQHYPAFIYIGKFYRNALHDMIYDHVIPSTWDYSIGYGSDVITTLAYYGLTDWSTVIFAVFSNADNGVVLYTAMMLFRSFLAGLFLFYTVGKL